MNKDDDIAMPLIKMHTFAAQGSEQKRKACIHFTWLNLSLASGIVMEIHCHINGICEAPMSSSLFSVHLLMNFPKSLLCPESVTKMNSPNLQLQRDWFMYHLRSTYKNCLEYPFKILPLFWVCVKMLHSFCVGSWGRNVCHPGLILW